MLCYFPDTIQPGALVEKRILFPGKGQEKKHHCYDHSITAARMKSLTGVFLFFLIIIINGVVLSIFVAVIIRAIKTGF